jgi:hypothetical protein
MHTKMTHTARAELANAIRRRYQAATGKEKHKILNEIYRDVVVAGSLITSTFQSLGLGVSTMRKTQHRGVPR